MTIGCNSNSSQQVNYVENSPLLIGEVTKKLFGYLPFASLFACAGVCKLWETITYDKDVWPEISVVKDDVNVFDAAEWKKIPQLSSCGISVDDEPELDKHKFFFTFNKINQILKSKSLSFEKPPSSIEQLKKFTLLTIPMGINLRTWISFVNQECRPFLKSDDLSDPEGFGELQVKKTYRILITNNMLAGSRVPYNQYAQAIKYLESVHGSRLPKILEIQALVSTACLNLKAGSGGSPYYPHQQGHGDSLTYCKEHTDQLTPGTAGLYLDYQDKNPTVLCFGYSWDSDPTPTIYASGESSESDEDKAISIGTGFVFEI